VPFECQVSRISGLRVISFCHFFFEMWFVLGVVGGVFLVDRKSVV